MWRRMVAIVEKSPSSASGEAGLRWQANARLGEQRLARLQREGGDTTAQGRHVELRDLRYSTGTGTGAGAGAGRLVDLSLRRIMIPKLRGVLRK